MTEQPDNTIRVIPGRHSIWVDVECEMRHGNLCAVGLASAKTKGAALRRAARRLRVLADQCEKMSK